MYITKIFDYNTFHIFDIEKGNRIFFVRHFLFWFEFPYYLELFLVNQLVKYPWVIGDLKNKTIFCGFNKGCIFCMSNFFIILKIMELLFYVLSWQFYNLINFLNFTFLTLLLVMFMVLRTSKFATRIPRRHNFNLLLQNPQVCTTENCWKAQCLSYISTTSNHDFFLNSSVVFN